mmetsp:Transcript_23227/g.72334  ORF Transcript_23227/g.72334 Transcript_23227/m.72334 type:complete len:161 (-) Transcript_23227:26-508(-)
MALGRCLFYGLRQARSRRPLSLLPFPREAPAPRPPPAAPRGRTPAIGDAPSPLDGGGPPPGPGERLRIEEPLRWEVHEICIDEPVPDNAHDWAKEAKEVIKLKKRWVGRWRKLREKMLRQGGSRPRPDAWPTDHLDRGVGTPGWDQSGASGREPPARRPG